MQDVLLLIDVINSFLHEDGTKLAASFRRSHPALHELISEARDSSTPIIYANDNWGVWNSDFPALLADSVENGLAGQLVASIAPLADDRVVIKPRYSAFRATPLEVILDELDVERLVVAGTATEMCVTQTAIDARESGYKVTVVPEACSSVSDEEAALALEYLVRVVGVQTEPARNVFASIHRAG